MPSYQLLNDLYAKALTAIQSLEQSPNNLYLGTATDAALNATEFISIAKEHILVQKRTPPPSNPQSFPPSNEHPSPSMSSQTSATIPASNQSLASPTESQNQSQATSETPETSQSMSDNSSEPHPPPHTDDDLIPIHLSLIAVVDSNNFFLTSDGKYNPASAPKPFADSKLQCSSYAPDFSPLSQHFTNALNAIRKIQNKVATGALPTGTNVDGPVKQENNVSFVKVRHILFEQRNAEVHDNSDPNDHLGQEWRMDHWPVLPRNNSVMEHIRPTHNVNPIPAYDVDGHLIRPNMYEDVLAGALVEIEFTLQHWYIRGNVGLGIPPKHQFSADLERIKVLSPPKIITSNYASVKRGIKRANLAVQDPGPSSPSKKSQTSS